MSEPIFYLALTGIVIVVTVIGSLIRVRRLPTIIELLLNVVATVALTALLRWVIF